MTKKCKSCQTEIDSKAKKCPHCRADQRNWVGRHPVLTVILGLIVFFIVIASIGGKSSDSQKVGSNTTGSTASTDSTGAKPTDSQTVYKVGDKIQLGDVILTVNSVDNSTGGQYSHPATGNHWVNLNMTIENTGKTQVIVSTLGQMFVLDDKNNQYQITVTDKRLDNPGSLGLDGTIVAGAKKTDWVGFEVPTTAKGLKFQYNASFFNDKNVLVDLGM